MFNPRAFHALNKTRARDVNVTLSGEETVSGTVNAPMTGTMYGSSIQSALPSPDYPSPILSAGGEDIVVGGEIIVGTPLPVLRGVGTVKDTLEYQSGNDWKLTRRIAVLELDGTESWTKYSSNTQDNVYYANVFAGGVSGYQSSICSHFKNVDNSWIATGNYGEYSDHTSIGNRKYFNLGSLYPTADDFKAWLAAQYVAGTPVTVAYVLETPVVTTATIGALSTFYPETNYFDENADVPIVFEGAVKKM